MDSQKKQDLALSMHSILSNEKYTRIFNEPPSGTVKTASAETVTKGSLVKSALKDLLKLSNLLDTIGLPKSSRNALMAVSQLVGEVKHMTDEELGQAALQAANEEELEVSE